VRPAESGVAAAPTCPRPPRRRAPAARLCPAHTASTSPSSLPHSARRSTSLITPRTSHSAAHTHGVGAKPYLRAGETQTLSPFYIPVADLRSRSSGRCAWIASRPARLMRRWGARCAGRQAGAHRDHRSPTPTGRPAWSIVSSGLVHRIDSGTLTSPSSGPWQGFCYKPRAAALAPVVVTKSPNDSNPADWLRTAHTWPSYDPNTRSTPCLHRRADHAVSGTP